MRALAQTLQYQAPDDYRPGQQLQAFLASSPCIESASSSQIDSEHFYTQRHEAAALHRWYLGIYIDAFEWVELPNTLGMSQFADGGLLATKPYVSSAAYVDRMSDYGKGCTYDKKQRVVESACPFNALYWDFYLRHAERLQKNPRIGMAYRQLERMDAPSMVALQARAQQIRQQLATL